MKRKMSIKNLIFYVLIVYAVGILINQQLVISKIKIEKNKDIEELNLLKQKNKELINEVKLSQSASYIEKIAREKLNMIKKGETPVINDSNK